MKNNSNWQKASAITKNILDTILSQDQSKQIFIINLPDEWNGAFIFRLGFKEALQIHRMDTSKFTVVNHLKREDMLVLPDSIIPVRTDSNLFVQPAVTVQRRSRGNSSMSKQQGRIDLDTAMESILLYWDKKTLKALP